MGVWGLLPSPCDSGQVDKQIAQKRYRVTLGYTKLKGPGCSPGDPQRGRGAGCFLTSLLPVRNLASYRLLAGGHNSCEGVNSPSSSSCKQTRGLQQQLDQEA